MSPETRAFLDRLRHAEDPTAEDQRRVLSGVRAAIVAGAAAGVGTIAPNASAAGAKSQLPWALSPVLKLAGGIAAVAAVSWVGGFLPFPSEEPKAPHSAVTPPT